MGPLLYITDYFLLATSGSARQTKAMAEALNRAAKEFGDPKGRIEGSPQSSWVLIDFGDVVAHVLTAESREFYALDLLWSDAREVPLEEPGSGQARAG